MAGAAAEMAFALLMDPVLILAKFTAMARLLAGARAEWAPQNRGERGVSWAEATSLLWPQTAIGVLVFAAFGCAGWSAVLWAAPLAGGLLVAVPFCVLTAAPRVSAWLRKRGVAAGPEELATGGWAGACGYERVIAPAPDLASRTGST